MRTSFDSINWPGLLGGKNTEEMYLIFKKICLFATESSILCFNRINQSNKNKAWINNKQLECTCRIYADDCKLFGIYDAKRHR